MPARRVFSTPLLAALLLAPTTAHADDVARDRDLLMGQRTGVVASAGAWAGINLLGGALLVADPAWIPHIGPSPAFRRSFGIAALSFAVVNTILVSVAFANTNGLRAKLTSPGAITAERASTGNLFAVNGGLDMLYVMAGAILWDRGSNDWLRGFGAGVTAQGAVLLGYDLSSATIYRYGGR